MEQAREVLQLVQPFVYGGVGLIALYRWLRVGGRPRGLLAAAFGSLAAIVVASIFLREAADEPAVEWARKAQIVVLVLFPYLLLRFTATFRALPRWVEWTAGLATGAAAAAVLPFATVPDPGEPSSLWWTAYLTLLLAQWTFVSLVVAVTLWRARRGHTKVARRRMQMMSAGALLLAAAILLSGVGGGEPDALAVSVALLGLVATGTFLLGFAPPPVVRLLWRRPEEQLLHEAELRLIEATTPDEVAGVVLPEVVRLTSGSGAMLVGEDGSVRAREGEVSGPTVEVAMRGGRLLITPSAYSPYFGRDEHQLLLRLALAADLALERVELLQRDRRARELLVEAQAIAGLGSWEWDVAANHVTWSDELYRIFGLEPGAFEATYEAFLERVHPDDRALVSEAVAAGLEQGEPFAFEHRVVRSDGEERVVLARGRVVLDAAGEVARMVGTGQDVTEQKREQRARDQFIANAAHELRTPLTAVTGLIQVLAARRDELSPEQAAMALDTLGRSAERIVALVNSLLDLTRLEQSRGAAELEPVDVSDALRVAVAAVPPPDGVLVSVDAEGAGPVLADRHRLDQVVTNLLTNAYKYGGPNVRLEARPEEDFVVVAVADDGPGVERSFEQDLFEPFSRGRGSAAATEGSGLGLAIARRAAEACGGTLWYEPARPTGARFCVRLRRPA